MPTLAPEKAEDIIARWLSTEKADDNNPADPLYLGGNHTVADITACSDVKTTTMHCGYCTGSYTAHCY
jgi:hypothetical protein